MKKKNIYGNILFVLFFILFIFFSLTSAEFNSYKLEKITEFKIGDGINEIGYKPSMFNRGIPNAIGFDKNSVYIGDDANNRVIILNYNLKQVNEIKNKLWLSAATQYEFDSNNEIIGRCGQYSIMKLDREFNLVFNIDYSILKNYRIHFSDNFIVFNNIIFSYLVNKKIICIINPTISIKKNINNIMDPAQTRALFQSNSGLDMDGLKLDQKNRLILNGEILTRDYDTFYSYWQEKHDENNEKQPKLNIDIKVDKYVNYPTSLIYLGRDKDGNHYWGADNSVILVYNKKGFLLDAFKYDENKSKTIPAVHPSGDIYFLGYKESDKTVKKNTEYFGEVEYKPVVGFVLYRIKRVW